MAKKTKGKSNSFLPIIILSVGLVLIIVAAALFVESNNQEKNQRASVGRVSPTEARNAFDRGDAIILDVRSESAYTGSHAAGAINIPLEDLGQRLNELDSEMWIITYCT